MDSFKPTLVVHPLFFKSLMLYDLASYFNILTLNDLFQSVELVQPILVTDTEARLLDNIVLSPTFANAQKLESGIKCECTTYWFDKPIPIYGFGQRAPRYIIWTVDDPLTICATIVDRVDATQLDQAYQRARNWAYTIDRYESVIVFDLDETLIDRECRKLKLADELLRRARELYDRVVLYSHGSNLHVDDNVQKFDPSIFDAVLSNQRNENITQKNLLHLYNYFPNTIFTTATLVDDSLYNWTPEYRSFVVPHRLSSLRQALGAIEAPFR